MKVSIHTLVVEQVSHTLGQLLVMLDKATAYAEAKKFDPAVLINARLAPDMLPFSKQIQIASDNAKFAAARLGGIEAPKFEDNEKTIDELKARVRKTIDYLKSVPAGAFEGGEDRDIKITVPGRTIEMKGLTYLQGWALPNVFFHVTTAYAILRHNGVDVGKRDFMGNL
ncbi:MAG: DUF1993 domain-containing protein [Gammaproteobacteria bacterium]